MAELIIQNPSITSGDFSFSGDAITAIAGHPVAGIGGGTQSDFVYVPSFNSETGDLTFNLGVTGTEGKGPWHISGATGPQGEQGIQGETGPAGADGSDGTDGKTPELRINPSNAEWQWKYTVDSNWINLGVTASGAVGLQGPTGADGKSLSAEYEEDSVNRQTQVKIGQINGSEQTSFYLPWGVNGINGTNGTSLSAKTSIITGGHRVEIWEKGASQYDDSFDVMDGENGVSPTVTVTNIPADPDDPNHKNGGTEITITDATATNKFSAWNGNDGTMAGAPDIEGKNGISAALDGSTYKVGLSATFYNAITSVSSTYATKDALDDYLTKNDAAESYQPIGNYLSANALNGYATQSWVEGKNYLVADDITGKADKTDLQYVSAGVDYVSGHIPSLNGYATEQYVQGASAEVTAWVGQQNYLTSVPSEYITETELSSELADYIKSISIETGLSGDGVTTALGIDTTASINFTNATAKSATSAGSATSAYSAYSANYATTAASAYIDANTTSAMSNIVDELHSKTSVTINTTNNEIKDGTSAVSAMSYVGNSQHAGWEPQKSCVCQESEIYAMSQLANGQGMLFFVVSAH